MADSAEGIIGPWPEIKVTTRDRQGGCAARGCRVPPFVAGQARPVGRWTTAAAQPLARPHPERIAHLVLNEAPRVAWRQHGLIIEPFADVKHGFRPWRDAIGRTCWRNRIGDLPRHALHPIAATDSVPQKRFVNVCTVFPRSGWTPITCRAPTFVRPGGRDLRPPV